MALDNNKLHGQGRSRSSPKFKWTHVHRVALHLMHDPDEGFALPQPTVEVIFRQIFKSDIIACGLNNLAPSSLRSQYRERETKPQVWSDVLLSPETPGEKALRRKLRDTIADAVRESDASRNAGISVHRTPSPGPIPTSPPRPSKRQGLLQRSSIQACRNQGVLRATSPVVLIPSTPSKQPSTVLVRRRFGGDVKAPVNKYNPCWLAPPKHHVQPGFIPQVLFRFWLEDQQHCHNSKDGFKAGFYLEANVMPDRPFRVEAIENTLLYYHVEGRPYPSPWISLSSCFQWSLKNAIKAARLSPGRRMNISLVSGGQLDPAGVYYLKPFMASLRPYYAFTKGKWMYGASYEWLVFDQVPKEAMLATIPLDSFLAMINTSPNVGRIIQLPILGSAPYNKLIERLQENSPTITASIAAAIGDCVQLLGLNASSAVEELSTMVGELVVGFAIKIKEHDVLGWVRLAGFFAHSFTTRSLQPISVKEQLLLRQSFILGCQLGLRDPNDKNIAEQGTARILNKLQRKHAGVGLDGKAAKMLWTELVEAQSQPGLHQERHERRFESLSGQLMLKDEVPVDGDTDGDFEDSLRVFSFEDEGRVV